MMYKERILQFHKKCLYLLGNQISELYRSFSTRNFLYIYVHLSIQLMTSIFYSLGTYRINCHLFKLVGYIILNDKGWLRWKRDIWPAKLYCFNVFVIFISYFAFQYENNRALKLLHSPANLPSQSKDARLCPNLKVSCFCQWAIV